MSKDKSFSFAMGVLAGVVGGIVAGVLYAPKPGEESRKELKDAACDFYEKHAPQIEEATKQALLEDGFLNLKDIGFIDKDGFVSVLSRYDDVIVL